MNINFSNIPIDLSKIDLSKLGNFTAAPVAPVTPVSPVLGNFMGAPVAPVTPVSPVARVAPVPSAVDVRMAEIRAEVERKRKEEEAKRAVPEPANISTYYDALRAGEDPSKFADILQGSLSNQGYITSGFDMAEAGAYGPVEDLFVVPGGIDKSNVGEFGFDKTLEDFKGYDFDYGNISNENLKKFQEELMPVMAPEVAQAQLEGQSYQNALIQAYERSPQVQEIYAKYDIAPQRIGRKHGSEYVYDPFTFSEIQTVDRSKDFMDYVGDVVKVGLPALAGAGLFGPLAGSISSGIGATGAANTALTGALTGAATAGVTGGDPLTAALTGGLGSLAAPVIEGLDLGTLGTAGVEGLTAAGIAELTGGDPLTAGLTAAGTSLGRDLLASTTPVVEEPVAADTVIDISADPTSLKALELIGAPIPETEAGRAFSERVAGIEVPEISNITTGDFLEGFQPYSDPLEQAILGQPLGSGVPAGLEGVSLPDYIPTVTSPVNLTPIRPPSRIDSIGSDIQYWSPLGMPDVSFGAPKGGSLFTGRTVEDLPPIPPPTTYDISQMVLEPELTALPEPQVDLTPPELELPNVISPLDYGFIPTTFLDIAPPVVRPPEPIRLPTPSQGGGGGGAAGGLLSSGSVTNAVLTGDFSGLAGAPQPAPDPGVLMTEGPVRLEPIPGASPTINEYVGGPVRPPSLGISGERPEGKEIFGQVQPPQAPAPAPQPVEPAPVEPVAPVEPTPEPAPVEPVAPAPVEPAPEPVEPVDIFTDTIEPTDPFTDTVAPVEPTPEPVEPVEPTPTPVEPTPTPVEPTPEPVDTTPFGEEDITAAREEGFTEGQRGLTEAQENLATAQQEAQDAKAKAEQAEQARQAALEKAAQDRTAASQSEAAKAEAEAARTKAEQETAEAKATAVESEVKAAEAKANSAEAEARAREAEQARQAALEKAAQSRTEADQAEAAKAEAEAARTRAEQETAQAKARAAEAEAKAAQEVAARQQAEQEAETANAAQQQETAKSQQAVAAREKAEQEAEAARQQSAQAEQDRQAALEKAAQDRTAASQAQAQAAEAEAARARIEEQAAADRAIAARETEARQEAERQASEAKARETEAKANAAKEAEARSKAEQERTRVEQESQQALAKAEQERTRIEQEAAEYRKTATETSNQLTETLESTKADLAEQRDVTEALQTDIDGLSEAVTGLKGTVESLQGKLSEAQEAKEAAVQQGNQQLVDSITKYEGMLRQEIEQSQKTLNDAIEAGDTKVDEAVAAGKTAVDEAVKAGQAALETAIAAGEARYEEAVAAGEALGEARYGEGRGQGAGAGLGAGLGIGLLAGMGGGTGGGVGTGFTPRDFEDYKFRKTYEAPELVERLTSEQSYQAPVSLNLFRGFV